MKVLLITALLASAAIASPSVDDFRWKKRLLVVSGPPALIQAKLAESKTELAARDVEIFFLNDPRIDKSLAEELRARLRIRADVAEVLLLGKDGRTTLRWKPEEFTVASLISNIDAMPMRQAEMRQRKAGD